MALVEINVPILKCKKCGCKWMPRPKKANIVKKDDKQYLKVDRCKDCKSIHWDKK